MMTRLLRCLVFTAAAAAVAQAAARTPHHPSDIVGPVPEGARVSIELDRDTWSIGENILIHFVVENTGEQPFRIHVGGDYRFASRPLRYQVTAIGRDGKAVADPDPSGFCLGGRSAPREIRPGKTFTRTLALARYCKFEKAGTYTIRAKHDLGWEETAERKIPVAEARIRLRVPSRAQAREIVKRMFKLPKDPSWTVGERRRAYADFTILRHPVYLPVLLEWARESYKDAAVGIGSIETPEATKALIGLLGHKNRAFVLHVAGILNCRLPDPEFAGKLGPRSPFRTGLYDRRRELAKKTWRPEFAEPVLARARELLSWRGKDSMAYAAFMYQCLAAKDDLPDLIAALDVALEQSTRLPRETRVYPSPRGACRELLRAARVLVQQGADVPVVPTSPGQAAVFLLALTEREGFRPQGWEPICAVLLGHRIPYVRELTLDKAPRPLPKSLVERLPDLLADADVDVRIAACRAAGTTKAPELREPVLKLVASEREPWPFRAACNAASALGARAEYLEILVGRLGDPDVGWESISTLMSACIEHHGSGGRSALEPGAIPGLKARWAEFLRDHREAVKAGRRFPIGSPEVTPDLVPEGYHLYRKDNTPWPPE